MEPVLLIPRAITDTYVAIGRLTMKEKKTAIKYLFNKKSQRHWGRSAWTTCRIKIEQHRVCLRL